MNIPDEADDKYYPLSIPENKESLIADLYAYCSSLEQVITKQKSIIKELQKKRKDHSWKDQNSKTSTTTLNTTGH